MPITRMTTRTPPGRNRNVLLARRRIRQRRTVTSRVLPVRTVRTHTADTLLPLRTGHIRTGINLLAPARTVGDLPRRTTTCFTLRTVRTLTAHALLPSRTGHIRTGIGVFASARTVRHLSTRTRTLRPRRTRITFGIVLARVNTLTPGTADSVVRAHHSNTSARTVGQLTAGAGALGVCCAIIAVRGNRSGIGTLLARATV